MPLSPFIATLLQILSSGCHPCSCVMCLINHCRYAEVQANVVVHRYWTFDQMIAHHTVGGCNLRPGDLLASGTISGHGPMEFGSLLEKTWGATRTFELETDSDGGVTQRGYLQDRDTVTLRGGCVGAGGGRVGFGECSGMLMPAR